MYPPVLCHGPGSSAFQGIYPVQIGPGISDDVGRIDPAGPHVDAKAHDRVVYHTGGAAAGNGRQEDHWKLYKARKGRLGGGDEKCIVSGCRLLKGGHLFKAHAAEDDLVIKGAYVVIGAAVRHIGHPEAAVACRDIGAAHVGDTGQGDASRRVKEHHGHLFPGNEG